jgi:bidirectional [NiFe] hydrogenase diaphorase subunit
MATYTRKPAPPNQDERWKLVDATMRRTGQNPRSLIESLHTVQEAFGYLSASALRYVAESLKVPLSHAFGVATFYHYFVLEPEAKHACTVCTGTSCHIRGSGELFAAARDVLPKSGNTNPNARISLLGERCIGPCSLGPVVVYDGQVSAAENVETLKQRLQKWMAE